MLNETPALAPDGQPYRLLTLRNSAGMVVTLMDWGATLLSARIPLSDGSVREALLGCASPEHYPEQTSFLGASIGRYANRIANSRYTFAGETVQLSPSQGENQLHGGPEGFDKRRWQIVNQNDRQVLFALTSDDGDQGFPGHLCATAQYRLTDDNRISITYRATVDKPCPVNLTNHVYFNLDGDRTDVRQHKLQILADEYLPVDESGIPRQGLKSVANTSFDFRMPKVIASEFLADDDQRKVKGYDHAFLLQTQGDGKKPAARLWSQDGKLQMMVYTTAPALQFYSGNYLAGTPSRGPEPYADWQGLALESELLKEAGYPDGFSTTLWSSHNHSTAQKVLQFTQQQLAQIGVKARITAMDAGQRAAEVEGKGQKESGVRMFYTGWSASTGEADWALSPLFASQNWPPTQFNTAFYSNKQVDSDLAAALKTNDPQEKTRLYKEAQDIIWKESPWIPLVVEKLVSAHSKNLTGFWIMPDTGFSFDDADLK